MKKRMAVLAGMWTLACVLVTGCGGTRKDAPEESVKQEESVESEAPEETTESEPEEMPKEEAETVCSLEDGIYTAVFDTDSGMFHVSEACDKKGTLTVENGQMTIHVSLASKNIVNLFQGTAEEAQKDGAVILEPTLDEVTYNDGIKEEVYGFDIPVPVIEEEFDVALVGKKGKWYDHKVRVSEPEMIQ